MGRPMHHLGLCTADINHTLSQLQQAETLSMIDEKRHRLLCLFLWCCVPPYDHKKDVLCTAII